MALQQKIKGPLLAGALLATLGVGSIGAVGLASAHNMNGGELSLISKLAAKFGVGEDEVKAVFDENRQDMQAEREAEIAQNLQELVDAGELTSDQKEAIEAKRSELETIRESQRADLEAWAEEQGIDLTYLIGRGGHSKDTRLQNALDKGDITEDQKNSIEAKQEELRTEREAVQTELKTWAEEQGIDLKYLIGRGGPERMGERKGMGHHGETMNSHDSEADNSIEP